MTLIVVGDASSLADPPSTAAPSGPPKSNSDNLPSFVPTDRLLQFEASKAAANETSNLLQPNAVPPTSSSTDGARKGENSKVRRTAALPKILPMKNRDPRLPANLTIGDPKKTPIPPPGPPKIEPIPDVIAAKNLFGAARVGSPLAARAIGKYSRGCLSGGVELQEIGATWQTMRPSRNRHWGHPKLVALVKRLAKEAREKDGWPGLLVGDISQPRGGPMLSGHRSHQVGLDADVWLTPMPDRKLSRRERERVSAISMLDKTWIAVDPKVFTDKHMALIRRAATYRQVQRIFVHPAIKKALCEWAPKGDRSWLGKVRPTPGHYYHFHIRMVCPPGNLACKPQRPVTGAEECGRTLDYWIRRVTPYTGPPRPKKKRKPRPEIKMEQMPVLCRPVLEAGPGGVKIPSPPKPTKLFPVVELNSPYASSPALGPHLRRLMRQ